MFFCFILLYETQLRAFCQHIFTYFLFAGTQKLGEGKSSSAYVENVSCVSISCTPAYVFQRDCIAVDGHDGFFV